jgi:protein involved in polysaccharide export with SLBB domain
MTGRLTLAIIVAWFACVAGSRCAFCQAVPALNVGCAGVADPSLQGSCDNATQIAGRESQSQDSEVTASTLDQQYPGLQNQSGYGRPNDFRDQGGLQPVQGIRQEAAQAQLLSQRVPASPPTEFQQLVKASQGRLLPIFGDTLFRQVPSTFAPLGQANVTAGYVIGPGDQLIIRLWGQLNISATLTVDRSGSVYLPHVGPIHVAGLSFSALQGHIRDAIGQYYRDFNLDVEMGQLRAIQVLVAGQARRPGTYTLGSLSTLVTALFATGGPSVQGSLRNIVLRRNGETIAHLDLYDVLIFGDTSQDTALLPGDVIFIPPVGAQIAIAGSVRNSAIYELSSQTTVGDALQFAGGLSATASLLHASLERIEDRQAHTTLDLTLQGPALKTTLRQGDVLSVIPIQPKFDRTITLRGNVAHSGRFEWHPGMKLSDIIPDSDSLLTNDYWRLRAQLGVPGPDFMPLPRANSQQNSLRYIPQAQSDEDEIQPIGAIDELPSGTVSRLDCTGGQQNDHPLGNAVHSPVNGGYMLPGACGSSGSVPLAATEQTSKSSMARAPLEISIPVPEIYWSYAVIERLSPRTLTTSLVPFNLGRLVLDHDPSQDLPLMSGDVVTIFSQADIKVPQKQRTKFVRLEGEFNHAGIYSVQPGETLRSLVVRAGGLTSDAYLFGSSFSRKSTRAEQQLRLDDYVRTLQLNMDRAEITAAASGLDVGASAASASNNLIAKIKVIRATGRIVLNIQPQAVSVDILPQWALQDGDVFTVPSVPVTVNVVGAVFNQNSFGYDATRTVGNYLAEAGGPNGTADKGDAFIIRADGAVISRRSRTGAFGNTFASSRLNPGDTLVVPEKIPRPSGVRTFLSYSQLFSNLAFGAAAIAVLH